MSIDNETFGTQIKSQFIKRMVNEFIDIIIMIHFQNTPFSGYDVLLYAKKHLEISLSPGNVYSAIYAMEQNGLIKVDSKTDKRTTFKVTEKGKTAVEVLTNPQEIADFMAKIIEGKPLRH